jgi:putative sporulation protein YtxC
VGIQEPRVPEVHVLFYNDEHYRLLDEEEKPLDQEYLRRVLGDLEDEDLRYEDLLLSALITLSPQRIILHHTDEPEVGKTIVNVFKERVAFCRDCALCRGLKR